MDTHKFSGLDCQKEIYLNGFKGVVSNIKMDLSVLERDAQKVLSPAAYGYIAGGAGSESTLNDNRGAFDKYHILPRMLRNVGVCDTGISLFGQSLRSPVLLSPVGVLELAHKESDVAVARAAATLGIPYIFSNQASKTMEECASVMGECPHWFQLYWSKSNDLVISFIRRAEACGCSAIVVTLDTTMLGWRRRDLDKAYLPFLEGRGIAQYTSDPTFQKMMDETEVEKTDKTEMSVQSIAGLIQMVRNYPGNGFIRKLRSGRPLKAVKKFISSYSNACTTWDDLVFLRNQTKLPIILKGILHPDDARLALEYGIDGIIVSNHGGRQVDGAIPALQALPEIVEVIKEKIPVLMDSGIRGGADVFKALAIGAKAVCIGRPYVYGLALAGERGVYEVLRNIMAEFELTMALSGCKNVAEINPKSLKASF